MKIGVLNFKNEALDDQIIIRWSAY